MTENNTYVTCYMFQVTKVTTFALPESINKVIEIIFINKKKKHESE